MSAAYCTLAEITTLGINPEAVEAIDPTRKEAAISEASDKMDGYLGAQFKLPLLTWGKDVRGCCARLAAIRLLRVRGTGPEDSQTLEEMEGRETAWLRDVAKGIVQPQVTDSSPSSELGVPSSQPRIVTASSRGFSRLPTSGAFGSRGDGSSFGA